MSLSFYQSYANRISAVLAQQDLTAVQYLARALQDVWRQGKRVYICGNGGSAANAMHIANDLLYGVSRKDAKGIRVTALTADSSVMTCLANDISYESIFSQQLRVQGEIGDILLALSGSGNSPNIVEAIVTAKEIGMTTFAILGYSGGKCLKLADTAIHFPVDDMQISEDMQLIVGHMVMRWLCENGRGSDGVDK